MISKRRRLLNANHLGDVAILLLAEAVDDDYVLTTTKLPMLGAIIDDLLRHSLTDAGKLNQVIGSRDV